MTNNIYKPQIVILTYQNRSGSTYLAELLDKYQEIGVSIEAEIPNGLNDKPSPVRKILKHFYQLKIKSYSGLEKYLNQLYAVSKFRNWNIDRDKLKYQLLDSGFPINFDDILYNIFSLYFNNNKNIQCIIFKNNSYIYYIDYIKKIIPEIKFIHILRDPRAIYNSQKKNKSSQVNKFMANSPTFISYNFNKICKIVDNHKNDSNFYLLKYEDLILYPEPTIKGILNFLNINNNKVNKDYSKEIPEQQKHLHKNINGPPITLRTQAWESELSSLDAFLIQLLCKNYLKKYMYNIKTITNISYCTIIFWYFKSKYESIKILMHRIIYWFFFYLKKIKK